MPVMFKPLQRRNIFQKKKTIQPVTTYSEEAGWLIQLNGIKAGLVQTHHMRRFCMPSSTVCSLQSCS